MPVNRCVCRDVPFEHVVRLAREEAMSFEAISQRTGCGTGCGMCVLYAKVAIRTGRASLPPMSDAELRRLLDEPSTGGPGPAK
jgi:bacterioferritin-associated ferredoxin